MRYKTSLQRNFDYRYIRSDILFRTKYQYILLTIQQGNELL